MLYITIKLPF